MKIVMIDRNLFEGWYTTNLLNSLSKFNYPELEILFYGPKNSGSKVKLDNVQIKKIWNKFDFPLSIIKELKNDKPDIIHIQFEFVTFGNVYNSLLFIPFLIFVKFFLKCDIVITLHGPFISNENSDDFLNDLTDNKFIKFIFPFYVNLTYEIILKLSNKIIVHASVFKDILMKKFDCNNGNKIKVIHHGIPSYKIIENNQKKVIFYFGTLSPRKGLKKLIEAFSAVIKKLPEYVLIIGGKESSQYPGYASKLNELIFTLNLKNKIIMSGHMTNKDLDDCFSKSIFFILPYPYSISACGPLTEGIAYEKPIIVTKTSFFKEFLTNNCSAILTDYQTEPIKDAMIKLIINKKLRKKLSQEVKKIKSRDSWDNIAIKTHKMYMRTYKKS